MVKWNINCALISSHTYMCVCACKGLHLKSHSLSWKMRGDTVLSAPDRKLSKLLIFRLVTWPMPPTLIFSLSLFREYIQYIYTVYILHKGFCILHLNHFFSLLFPPPNIVSNLLLMLLIIKCVLKLAWKAVNTAWDLADTPLSVK